MLKDGMEHLYSLLTLPRSNTGHRKNSRLDCLTGSPWLGKHRMRDDLWGKRFSSTAACK